MTGVIDGLALGVVSVDVAPNSNIFAVASLDSKIRLFDIETLQNIKLIDASPVDSWKVKFSPNGKAIATGSISGKVNLYTCGEGETIKTQFDTGKFSYSVDFVSISQTKTQYSRDKYKNITF